MLALAGLDARGSERFGDYSFGMKQRLGIAAALLGDPALLVLDEPTNGLDPAGINEMRDFIRSVGDGRRTVLVSSHILSELEQVCDWLIVIDQGSLVYRARNRDSSAAPGPLSRSRRRISATSIVWPSSHGPAAMSHTQRETSWSCRSERTTREVSHWL